MIDFEPSDDQALIVETVRQFAENEIRLILTLVKVNNELERVADACMPFYERLHDRRLGA